MAEEDKTPTPPEEPARRPKREEVNEQPTLDNTDMSIYKRNKNAPKPYNFGEEQRTRR